MISGRSGGSGKYSYREVHNGQSSVTVSHMPEDSFKVRIAFRSHGETHNPILKLNDTEAELLWAALNAMSKDLKWDDRMISEMQEISK